MTDQTDTTTEQSTDEQATGQQTPAPEPEQVEQPDTEQPEEGKAEEGKAGREAAKYRRQLRDAEAERDSLRGTVETLQRRMIEKHAGQTIAKPEALWAAGIDLGDLLDGDGMPDDEKVRAACVKASESLGLSRPRGGNYVPGEGRATRVRTGVGDGFTDAFRAAQ